MQFLAAFKIRDIHLCLKASEVSGEEDPEEYPEDSESWRVKLFFLSILGFLVWLLELGISLSSVRVVPVILTDTLNLFSEILNL